MANTWQFPELRLATTYVFYIHLVAMKGDAYQQLYLLAGYRLWLQHYQGNLLSSPHDMWYFYVPCTRADAHGMFEGVSG